LALIWKEENSGRVVACRIDVDGFKEMNNPVDLTHIKKSSKIYELDEICSQLNAYDKVKPNKPYEVIFCCFGAVEPRFSQFQFVPKSLKYILADHPMASQVKFIMTDAFNGTIQRVLTNLHYETIDKVYLHSYKNSKGYNPFEGYEKTIEKLKSEPFDSIWLMALTKERFVNFLIPKI